VIFVFHTFDAPKALNARGYRPVLPPLHATASKCLSVRGFWIQILLVKTTITG